MQVGYVQVASYNGKYQKHEHTDYVDFRDDEREIMIGMSQFDPAFSVPFWHTCLEFQEAIWAGKEYPDQIILMDNSLLPFLPSEKEAGCRQLRHIVGLFEEMINIPICGYVSGARSTYLCKLLEMNGYECPVPLTDSLLYLHILEQGERSTLFQTIDWRNRKFAHIGVEIYCFFLKVNKHEVARIEVSAWIAKDPYFNGCGPCQYLEGDQQFL